MKPRRSKTLVLAEKTQVEKHAFEKIVKAKKRAAENLILDTGTYSGEYVRLSDRYVVRHGKGKFKYRDGFIYEGGWHVNEKYGAGVLVYPSGERFEV